MGTGELLKCIAQGGYHRRQLATTKALSVKPPEESRLPEVH